MPKYRDEAGGWLKMRNGYRVHLVKSDKRSAEVEEL